MPAECRIMKAKRSVVAWSAARERMHPPWPPDPSPAMSTVGSAVESKPRGVKGTARVACPSATTTNPPSAKEAIASWTPSTGTHFKT